MNTQKYEKLDSYSRIDAAKKKDHRDVRRRAEAGSQGKLFDRLKERIFRDEMLKDRRRPDGRKFDEIRKIDVEVGVLPRTHGSASSRAAKRRRWSPPRSAPRTTSSASNCWIRRNPPSASCCTTTSRRSASAKSGFMRGAGRREIGHGALAERALSRGRSRRKSVPLHHARGQRHSGIERFELHGLGLRRDALA